MTTPDPHRILADLQAILQTTLALAPTPLDRQTRFFADLGLASIDVVVLGEAIQKHYARPLPFHTLMAELGTRNDRDFTLGELVDFVHNQLGTSPPQLS